MTLPARLANNAPRSWRWRFSTSARAFRRRLLLAVTVAVVVVSGHPLAAAGESRAAGRCAGVDFFSPQTGWMVVCCQGPDPTRETLGGLTAARSGIIESVDGGRTWRVLHSTALPAGVIPPLPSPPKSTVLTVAQSAVQALQLVMPPLLGNGTTLAVHEARSVAYVRTDANRALAVAGRGPTGFPCTKGRHRLAVRDPWHLPRGCGGVYLHAPHLHGGMGAGDPRSARGSDDPHGPPPVAFRSGHAGHRPPEHLGIRRAAGARPAIRPYVPRDAGWALSADSVLRTTDGGVQWTVVTPRGAEVRGAPTGEFAPGSEVDLAGARGVNFATPTMPLSSA